MGLDLLKLIAWKLTNEKPLTEGITSGETVKKNTGFCLLAHDLSRGLMFNCLNMILYDLYNLPGRLPGNLFLQQVYPVS